jgi:hypothetical protein
MKIKILYGFIILLLMSGCLNEKHYEGTYDVYKCNGLYCDVYRVFWGGIYEEHNARAIYITDSKNFRIYLGIFGEDDSYRCRINGDNLYIEKTTRGYADTPIVVERRKYKLSELKKEHRFD